ncbi:class I SAM-dependent methyltransferase [Streptomyces sp. NPDC101151]|uniref:class I SAM-dependent methyltransferase n=1 Tax=Streptomyces sp. NPDC101151 TaxID=3366115 RepID=UPI0037FF1F23
MEAVSFTAQWTAAARAIESDRADSLFTDPFARTLAGESGFRLLERYASPVTVDYLALRTAYLDRIVVRAAEQGIRQVVFVAGGMDTRPYRLTWPGGTTLYELDHAELLKAKDELLADHVPAAGATRITVPVDLAGPWEDALTAAGLDEGAATLWVVEGLLYYLPEEVACRLLRSTARLSGPGSVLCGDVVSEAALNNPVARPFLEALAEDGAPWLFGADKPEELLARCGWSAQGVVQPGEDGSDRWPYLVLPRHVPDVPRNFLFTAELTMSQEVPDAG